MIFLIFGIIGIALGIVLVVFRKAAAAHAEGQMSRVISANKRPSYAPWFIVLIGIGMISIGAYFIVAAVLRLAS
jgi:ABC-type cobalt transport system substrate-binding protein